MKVASARPLNKITAGTISAALGVIALWFLKAYLAIELPGEVQAAGAVVLFAVVAYFVPLAPGEVVEDHLAASARYFEAYEEGRLAQRQQYEFEAERAAGAAAETKPHGIYPSITAALKRQDREP